MLHTPRPRRLADGVLRFGFAAAQQPIVIKFSHVVALFKDSEERIQSSKVLEAQKRAWKKAMIEVHAEMESRVGKSLLADIDRATGFDPAGL